MQDGGLQSQVQERGASETEGQPRFGIQRQRGLLGQPGLSTETCAEVTTHPFMHSHRMLLQEILIP